MASGRAPAYPVSMSGKKRAKNLYLVPPRRVDAREILALARAADKPLFRVSGTGSSVEFIKGLLKLMGVPARRIRCRSSQ